MIINPEDRVNKFYKNLKVDKDTRALIKFYRDWRKEAQKQLSKKKAT